MIWLAALLSGASLLLARPAGVWLARQRLGSAERLSVRPGLLVAPLAFTGLVAAMTGLPAAQLIVALTVGGVGWFALRQVRAERERRRAQARRDTVAEVVGLMAAELRAGILPQRALAGLAVDFAFLTSASRAAELGGDVSSALRRESATPGCELLADVSSAWMVAERSGAPLARVLDRLEASMRDDREIEREVQSGVAPARATGRLMAVLPVVGLTLGSGMGADPVTLLTGTVPGALCLAAGSACACAGVGWVNRIAATAERTR
ncbi:MAG: type II secretion system F family protein [Aeromicrobium sp.]